MASKAVKVINKDNNLKYLKTTNLQYTVLNDGNQINIVTSVGIIAFYPTTNKWVYNNKAYNGIVKDLVTFIDKITELTEE